MADKSETPNESWTQETMRMINALTPDIQGKAFDPDWFLLRQHLQQMEDRITIAQSANAELLGALREAHTLILRWHNGLDLPIDEGIAAHQKIDALLTKHGA